jgi:uncharacterized membrane protein (UPF0136 family)
MKAKDRIALSLVAGMFAGLLWILCCGCQTVNKEQTCETARAAYAVYLAVIESGGAPNKDQIIAAKAAAAFLAAYCGEVPKAERGLPPGPRTHPTDANGVLILHEFR